MDTQCLKISKTGKDLGENAKNKIYKRNNVRRLKRVRKKGRKKERGRWK